VWSNANCFDKLVYFNERVVNPSPRIHRLAGRLLKSLGHFIIELDKMGSINQFSDTDEEFLKVSVCYSYLIF
jgi:hypothetical protein